MKNYPQKLLLQLIHAYQKTFSPDHGFFKLVSPHTGCKFHPTCSNYTYEAVEKFGVIYGLWLGSKRVLRCHPWSKGGHDPVPERGTK